jgi:hypothetical protein
MLGLLVVLALIAVTLWLTAPPAPKPWTDVDPQAWMRAQMRDV